MSGVQSGAVALFGGVGVTADVGDSVLYVDGVVFGVGVGVGGSVGIGVGVGVVVEMVLVLKLKTTKNRTTTAVIGIKTLYDNLSNVNFIVLLFSFLSSIT